MQPAPQVRSCCRCGAVFPGDPARVRRICPACHKPGSKQFNPQLTFREKQVATLVSQGKLNKEVAAELHLTEGTVKQYLNHVFYKVGVSSRMALAIRWAARCE
jgi:DNA-binding NarL/FixJ family response regulator